jgi:peptidoglycan/LPS O-acetylase OafA/YrhL
MDSLLLDSRRPVTPDTTKNISTHIKPLTGVRFLAAMWVVLFHFRDELLLVPGTSHLQPVVALGHLAVPLFFVLSGFILSHTYFARYTFRSHAQFVFLRFARLWPVHLATILLMMAYMGAILAYRGRFEGDSYPVTVLPLELAMVRSWASKDFIWNYPAWSIQAEWFAYIFVFPVAALLFRRVSSAAVLGMAVAGLLLGHVLLPIDAAPGVIGKIVLLFLAGSALYRLRLALPYLDGKSCVNLGLASLAAAVLGVSSNPLYFACPAFALLVLGLSYERGWLAELLSTRSLVYGGSISYSIYMVHAVVLKAYGPVRNGLGIDGAVARPLAALCCVGVVVAAAAFLYRFVEEPSNRNLRAWSPFDRPTSVRRRISTVEAV